MKKLSDLFDRFKKLAPPNDSVRKELAHVVEQVTGTRVQAHSIKIAHGVAFVAGSSVFKNTLQIKRGEILPLLYERLPKSRDTVRDLR